MVVSTFLTDQRDADTHMMVRLCLSMETVKDGLHAVLMNFTDEMSDNGRNEKNLRYSEAVALVSFDVQDVEGLGGAPNESSFALYVNVSTVANIKLNGSYIDGTSIGDWHNGVVKELGLKCGRRVVVVITELDDGSICT